jgi:hypothetical protein
MSPMRRTISVTIAAALTVFGAYVSYDWWMYGGKKVLGLRLRLIRPAGEIFAAKSS